LAGREFSGLMALGVEEMDAKFDREWNQLGSPRSAT